MVEFINNIRLRHTYTSFPHLSRLKIGGTKQTVLLIAALSILFLPIYNLEFNMLFTFVQKLLTMAIIVVFIIDVLNNNLKMQTIYSKLNFVSSKIPFDDKREMETEAGIYVGKTTDRGLDIFFPYAYLLKHVIILGSTGSGKTTIMKAIMTQNIKNGGGAIFIDGKMDYEDLQGFYDFLYTIGRHKDLLVISPGNPEMSNTYNPVYNGDAQEIASRVISLLPQDPRADFYRNEGYKALVALIEAAKKISDVINMNDLAILMSNEEALLRLEAELNKKFPNDEVTLQYSLYLDGYRERAKDGGYQLNTTRLKANISGTAAKPYQFGNGLFGEITGDYDPDINLLDCITGNKIVYVLLPTMNKPDAAKEFGKIFMSDFRTVVGWLQQNSALRPKIPFMVIMDEAGGYANENWDTLFQQCRSARISLFFSAQSVANLKEISPAFYSKIKENTIISIFMKAQSQDGCEAISELIGQQWATLYSQNIGKGDNSSGSTKALTESSEGESGNIGYSESSQLVNIVNPSDIKKLGTGEAIVFYDGRLIFHIKTPFLVAKKKLKFSINKVRKYRRRMVGLNMKKLLPSLLKSNTAYQNTSSTQFYGKRGN